ncbi:MAG: histidinol dehydrogenase, partial [Candidatus Dormibacteria bacterium]
INAPELARALAEAPAGLVAALEAAATNIARVHGSQRFAEAEVAPVDGVLVWRTWRPLRRVGIYVPGGRAPYPSSVLMMAVPARLAGCAEVVICSPPGRDGRVAPAILAAAALVNATEVHAVGGVQAVAAMAYGTETMRPVEKIFGPGNAYVTAAKRLVFGEVAVDMPAGPSEVVVVTDGSVPAAWLAADLEAQSEHAPDALGILVSTSPQVASEVATLVDPAVAAQVRLFTAAAMEEAIDFANEYAPEHLILALEGADGWLERVSGAGSVFLGPYAPAAVGDYATGANHVIPTGGLARSFSALGLEAFGHTLQVQRLSRQGLEVVAPVAREISRVEGFRHHWQSISRRIAG